jgi:hypothetical protein
LDAILVSRVPPIGPATGAAALAPPLEPGVAGATWRSSFVDGALGDTGSKLPSIGVETSSYSNSFLRPTLVHNHAARIDVRAAAETVRYLR